MDSRIQAFVDQAQTTFGLGNYFLHHHTLWRDVNHFNETSYTLCLEWFPNGTESDEDGSNPEGTAIIEYNVNTGKLETAIFVMGETYAQDGITFNSGTEEVIKWIEQETGLTYNEQFQLHNETEDEIEFRAFIDGIPVSPSGYIEVKWNDNRELTFFSIHGEFPTDDQVIRETYNLSLEQAAHIAKEQVKGIEFPSFEQKKLFAMYAVEEIYIRNKDQMTKPFEMLQDGGTSKKVNHILQWNETIFGAFERKEIDLQEEITVDEAFSCTSSPTTRPITEEDEKKCVEVVERLLCQEFPEDAGIWRVTTLHRDKNFLVATLGTDLHETRVFKRKLSVFLDSHSMDVVNYIDNQFMLEMYDSFEASGDVAVTQEEAYEKLKGLFELQPFYVYDDEEKQYILCSKLDCHHGVNAETGEVVLLDDLG
ncbi:hypothetical protein ABE65_012250 [Fictibacillus phosphorivorans]|uniref:DUF4901 domain-containing protein n=1 Tax=Fictibacillus phosphorivorans TaxID=1221500 RepID=A0A160IN75_9BACL|nr:hypothetical protein [Fictibacillus phosphorivorans]ANC77527.1 hypothetical protein ABE65_012250 [Fictibacillus phosphorivorans]